ncbi:hypothetical protein LJC72_05765 [Bacteroides sp. OttesenSCG-928-D19]|nr:hypothetical protein [Bacteroides sp. OttesenSCG-928-N06]MDL2304833.1 hypothetical protein [Bacteroides sp. OttesenSCG-928-D19]
MIDRIKFYIKDVNFDDIEKRLDLIPAGVAKDGSWNYSTNIKNLRVTYRGRHLSIDGSLHKYAKGNNYSLFTYEEAKRTIKELSEYIGISLERFIVSKMELGLNLPMDNNSEQYLGILHSYKSHPFIYMSPYGKTSKLKGRECHFSEYQIKLYDKTFEAMKRERNKKEREKIPANILRFEIDLHRNKLSDEGFKNVTGKNLQSNLHYSRFKKLMNEIFSNIVFNDTSINYSTLLEDEVKRYIFATSDGYDRYLQYLKDYVSEKEYRKERRRTNNLLKKIAPLIKGELEAELKSKFKLGISKI